MRSNASPWLNGFPTQTPKSVVVVVVDAMDADKLTIGIAVLVVVVVVATLGAALAGPLGFAQPIESGTYEGQKIDYSHQRGLIFQTNDLTTKTNDRSSTTEDWCVPDNNDALVQQVRNIEEGEYVRIEYTRPLWIWPDTCQGGLKVITDIETVNESQISG